jgi:hypothetical protein
MNASFIGQVILNIYTRSRYRLLYVHITLMLFDKDTKISVLHRIHINFIINLSHCDVENLNLYLNHKCL